MFKFASTVPVQILILIQLFLLGIAASAPQDGQVGYVSGRIPILYEAYYPEPQEWSPQANLREIEKLRDLTSQLLKEEEELGRLAAAAVEVSPENVLEPRSQVLEYVFSRPAASPVLSENLARPAPEDIQVASITVSDSGPRKTRHHHGDANWLRRRLVGPNTAANAYP